MQDPQGNTGLQAERPAIPDHGVHAAGRFRSTQAGGSHSPVEVGQARNVGPDRVSFGFDPAKPHAHRMHAKETARRHGMMGVMQANASDAISVQQWRCAMVRNRNANCMKCAQACTSGCISVVDDRLAVDAALCTGCGTCATVCPTCSIESRSPSDAELLDACLSASVEDSEGARMVVIACNLLTVAAEGALDMAKAVQVVCLGRVDESLLVALAARGVKKVVLASGVCGNCEQATGLQCARAVVDSASEILAAWGCDCKVAIQQGLPAECLAAPFLADSAAAQLEAFFSQARSNPPIRPAGGQGGTASVAQEQHGAEDAPGDVLKVMADGTLPHFVPARRERLLDELSSLGAPVSEVLTTRLWGHVAIDPGKCVSCRMCAVFCPTGALEKYGEQDSDDFGLEHYPGACVNCGTCEAICPQDAIEISTMVESSCLLSGKVQRFPMLPRAVALNSTHQIVNTMRSYIDGDIFER